MTPIQYANRYLPVMAPGDPQDIPINISRYHRGDPTAAQQALWTAANDFFRTNKKKNPGFQLTLRVNDTQVPISSAEDVRMSLVRPFWGKGSPEDCQIVLQTAMLFGGVRPERLQAWADENVGLDCNGYVGNYIFHDVIGRPWTDTASESEPGPSADIQVLFGWVTGVPGADALTDPAKVTMTDKYLIVRADAHGVVIPGGKAGPGHCAITEPGQIMRQSFVSNSMGEIDPTYVRMDMYNHQAVRTAESAGPYNGDKGLGFNWMVFQRKHERFDNVFWVNRDNIHYQDLVKIAPLIRTA